MEGELEHKDENLELMEKKFKLGLSEELVSKEQKQKLGSEVLELINKRGLVTEYEILSETFPAYIPHDPQLLSQLRANAATLLEAAEAKIKDAEENLGESEIRNGWLAKAHQLALAGKKDLAIAAYKTTIEKTVGSGERLDVVFTLIRLGLFYDDTKLFEENLEKAKNWVETGGDWDRRNRLRVYEAIHHIKTRKFNEAAALLLATLSTFTCTELMDYKQFIFYTVICTSLALPRPELKTKIIDSPDVLSVIHQFQSPNLSDFMTSLYNCDYQLFFTSLASTVDFIKLDPYLAPHASFFCRELRIKAYSQLLQSYRSVQLSSMASAFGVSIPFIDHDLSRFIASGRIHCKIDKVSGIVETNLRLDQKNNLYHQVIKAGDAISHRLSTLSQSIL